MPTKDQVETFYRRKDVRKLKKEIARAKGDTRGHLQKKLTRLVQQLCREQGRENRKTFVEDNDKRRREDLPPLEASNAF